MREAEALPLGEEERELVLEEVEALLPSLPPERREPFRALAEAVREGEVPASLLPPLESLLTLALVGGRARTRYRAEGERILTELYRRTPRGRELERRLREVNRALEALAGRRLRAVRVGWYTLGRYTLRLEAEGVAVTLEVGPQGVEVESLAVGSE